MTCKLCGGNKKLVDAHVIPRSFYKDIVKPTGKIVDAGKHYSKKSLIGIYDPNLVCHDCERRFHPWDTYAVELLLADYEEKNYVNDHTGKRIIYIFQTIDYAKLKLFFLSVLWRAGRSTHEFFRNLDLGPHELVIREMILRNDPGDATTYSVVVKRCVGEEEVRRRCSARPEIVCKCLMAE